MSTANDTSTIAHSIAGASGLFAIILLLVQVGFVFVVLGLVGGRLNDTSEDYGPAPPTISLVPKDIPAWNCHNCGGPNTDGHEMCEWCGMAKE